MTRTAPASALCAALVAGCGVIDMSPEEGSPSAFAGLRRAFVGDSAANDSLAGAWVREGLKFVLQPGKSYEFRLAAPFAADRMGVYLYQGGRFIARNAVTAVDVAGEEVFPLRSDQLQAEFYVVRLITGDAGAAAARLDTARTRLLRVTPVESGQLAVKLILVGSFVTMPGGNSKDAFRIAFLDTLAAIFAGYGVSLQTSYEYASPTAPPVHLAFDQTFYPLDGTREAGAAHVYVVDSIYVPGAPAGSGTILGFAPREAMDMSENPESRVVLNARGGPPERLATTAAHELGHFFGLRHPTATALDLQADDDLSNRDDGFASTPLCPGLSKRSAEPASGPSTAIGPGGRPYCLFVTAPFVCAGSRCDLTNLMFPYDCSDSANAQRALTGEQQTFVRSHIGMLQGL